MSTARRIATTITALALTAAATITIAAPAQAYTNRDRAFVHAVRHDAWEARYVPTRTLIKIAHSTCTALRNGVDPLDIVAIAVDNGLEENTGITLTAGSVAWYCPDMGYLFDTGA